MKELNQIQTKLKAPKNQFNKFGGYKYRSLEDITEAVKPHLAELGCALLINDVIEVIGDRHYVKATATLINPEGQSIEVSAYAREPMVKKGMDEAQITGATSSYARKYALNGLFAIDDTKDADATNNHEHEQQSQPKRVQKQKQKMTIEQAREAIEEAKDLSSLAAVWTSLPGGDLKKQLTPLKDARKEALGG